MMNKFGKVMCLLPALFLTTSCNNAAYLDKAYINSDVGTYSPSPSLTDIQPITDKTHSSIAASFSTEESSVINNASLRKFQFDLNEDGISEDIIIRESSYEIIMYIDESHSKFSSFILPRVNSIDIFRRPLNKDKDEYTYSFSYIYGENKGISYQLVYTGGGEMKNFVGGTGYRQTLSPNISYHEHFVSMPQEDFENLINDPHHFLKECREPGWEYLQTLNLEETANSECTKHNLNNIKINDAIGEIQIVSLNNDIFGSEIELVNEKYSVYVSNFDHIEIYERIANIEIPTNSYGVYEQIQRDDKEYLLCLKSYISDSTEYVYTGTANEKYLFLYNFDSVKGFSIESPESIQKDGWQNMYSIDVCL